MEKVGIEASYINEDFITMSRKVASSYDSWCDLYLSNELLDERGLFMHFYFRFYFRGWDILVKEVDPREIDKKRKWPVYATIGRENLAIEILTSVGEEIKRVEKQKYRQKI